LGDAGGRITIVGRYRLLKVKEVALSEAQWRVLASAEFFLEE